MFKVQQKDIRLIVTVGVFSFFLSKVHLGGMNFSSRKRGNVKRSQWVHLCPSAHLLLQMRTVAPYSGALRRLPTTAASSAGGRQRSPRWLLQNLWEGVPSIPRICKQGEARLDPALPLQPRVPGYSQGMAPCLLPLGWVTPRRLPRWWLAGLPGFAGTLHMLKHLRSPAWFCRPVLFVASLTQ